MQNILRIMLANNMPRKLPSITAREEGLGGNAGPCANMQEEARFLSQPLVQVLTANLELLSVPPLEEDKVMRELLGSGAALGVQMVAGGYRPALAILRQMESAFSTTSALLAFQSALCVENGETKSAWFEAVSPEGVNKLTQGRGDFDLWRILVVPMLLKRRSSQFMKAMTPLEAPSDFFTDGKKLRLGSPVIQEYFDVIGMSGTAGGTYQWRTSSGH